MEAPHLVILRTMVPDQTSLKSSHKIIGIDGSQVNKKTSTGEKNVDEFGRGRTGTRPIFTRVVYLE